jgi:molybdate transport system regulatory protein
MDRQSLKMRLRLKFGEIVLLGPGKADLLDAVDRTGSISAAAREMNMSYKRAWMLIDEMNRHLDHPVVDATFGGKAGGGTSLTEFGREVRDRFRRIEDSACAAIAEDMAWLETHAVER